MLAKREVLVGSPRVIHWVAEGAQEERQCLGHCSISGLCQPVNSRLGLCGCFSLVVIPVQRRGVSQPGVPQ